MTENSLLTNFNQDITALIVGASGGIGRALVHHLANDNYVKKVIALSRSDISFDHNNIETGHIDVLKEQSIEAAAEHYAKETCPDLIVVATGLLHNEETGLWPEKALRDLSSDGFAHAFALNTTGPALVAKHFLKNLDKEKKTVFAAISARVGSISDNKIGGWYAYRASKAALNMVLRTTAIEVNRRYKKAIIAGLHPGTVDTNLSEPFQGQVPEGKLFTPEYSAESLLNVINGLTPEDSGHLFAWDGERIPF